LESLISSVFAETCKISTFPLAIFERLVVVKWKASGSYPEDWLKGDQESRGRWKGHSTFCRGRSGARKTACRCDYLQIDCHLFIRSVSGDYVSENLVKTAISPMKDVGDLSFDTLFTHSPILLDGGFVSVPL